MRNSGYCEPRVAHPRRTSPIPVLSLSDRPSCGFGALQSARSALSWAFVAISNRNDEVGTRLLSVNELSSDIRTVCQRMVDQTLTAGNQASANGTRRLQEALTLR